MKRNEGFTKRSEVDLEGYGINFDSTKLDNAQETKAFLVTTLRFLHEKIFPEIEKYRKELFSREDFGIMFPREEDIREMLFSKNLDMVVGDIRSHLLDPLLNIEKEVLEFLFTQGIHVGRYQVKTHRFESLSENDNQYFSVLIDQKMENELKPINNALNVIRKRIDNLKKRFYTDFSISERDDSEMTTIEKNVLEAGMERDTSVGEFLG